MTKKIVNVVTTKRQDRQYASSFDPMLFSSRMVRLLIGFAIGFVAVYSVVLHRSDTAQDGSNILLRKSETPISTVSHHDDHHHDDVDSNLSNSGLKKHHRSRSNHTAVHNNTSASSSASKKTSSWWKKRKKRDEFKSKNDLFIPEEEWDRLDALICYTKERGDGPDLEKWQRRAPYGLIIGAMKAGTTALNKYLTEHSNVLSYRSNRKELHFYDFMFGNFSTKKGILRRSARQAYKELYEENVAVETLQASSHMVAMDDSPRYLFYSDRIPARVLCVTPWVKILAILRNPIDRAFSHYNMFYTRKNVPGLTFQKWIDQDLEDLKATGVIQNKIPLSEFRGSKQEREAWKAYTRLGTHAPLGRGLYALQLRHWFEAFEAAGKNLEESFLIIQSEKMKKDPDLVYDNVLDFLGLKDEKLVDDEKKFVASYSIELANSTRQFLEEFYAPYNQELYDLLGKEWDGVWDP